jgi:deoxyhypusine synthase
MMQPREFRDGAEDGLQALEPLNPDTIRTFSDLLAAMKKTAFGGRRLGEAYEVLSAMIGDPDCSVVMTLSGAMTIAKMGRIITSMIDHGMVNVIVSTGALIAHGLSESVGKTHYRHDPGMSDEELFRKGYNRVYDTLELEKNLDDTQVLVDRALASVGEGAVLSSVLLHERLGALLHEQGTGRGILRSAYEKGVAVYVPAFTDSELGLDVALHNRRRRSQGKAPLRFDAFSDLDHYTEWARSRTRLGVFTIGGGVPRNWAQQVGPYVELMAKRLGEKEQLVRFHYGVRLCPEPAHWGGLSGCTYSEGVSWGKFVPEEEGGRFVEALEDATVAWPLVVRAVMERSDRSPPPWKAFAAGRSGS